MRSVMEEKRKYINNRHIHYLFQIQKSVSLTLFIFLVLFKCLKTPAKSLCKSRARICPKFTPSTLFMTRIQSNRSSLLKSRSPSARTSYRDTTERLLPTVRLELARLTQSQVQKIITTRRGLCRELSKASFSRSSPTVRGNTWFVSLTLKFTTKRFVTCSIIRARN